MRCTALIFLLLAAMGADAIAQNRPSDSQCPTITVTGPAGIAEPGELLPFSVSLTPDVATQPLRFQWRVSGGAIVGRQDTRTLEVRPEKYFNKSTTVTVKVIGLPDSCPNEASEMSQTVCDPYLVLGNDVSLWNQYSDATWQEERENLDSLAIDGLKRHPQHVIYLEKTFGKEAAEKVVKARLRQISNYLNKVRRIPKSQFYIRILRGGHGRTTGYLVPPDAPVLDPKYVEPCLQ
jgi:hypothetical protein